MSIEQPTQRVSIKRRGRPVLTVPAAVVIGALLLLWGLQCIIFPSSDHFRSVISAAERVELQAFIENSGRKPLVLAVITDRKDILALASSVELRGIWLPFDELTGNSFRIRAVLKQQNTDIVIRGGYRLKCGDWFIGISPSLMDTFVRLVEDSGGKMPSLNDLRGDSR